MVEDSGQWIPILEPAQVVDNAGFNLEKQSMPWRTTEKRKPESSIYFFWVGMKNSRPMRFMVHKMGNSTWTARTRGKKKFHPRVEIMVN